MTVATYKHYQIQHSGISYNCPAVRGVYGYPTDVACAKAIAKALKEKYDKKLFSVVTVSPV